MLPQPVVVQRLVSGDVALLRKLNALFAEVFDDPDTYSAGSPSDAYVERLLARDHIFAVVATIDTVVVGGLTAYELDKFEMERRELYIYDLAVATAYRRQGIATSLISYLRRVAEDHGAWVIYVQADHGDMAAIALYEKLGIREDVMHFDIQIASGRHQRF